MAAIFDMPNMATLTSYARFSRLPPSKILKLYVSLLNSALKFYQTADAYGSLIQALDYMVDPCPQHDIPTTKAIDLLHTVWEVTLTPTSIDMCNSISTCRGNNGIHL